MKWLVCWWRLVRGLCPECNSDAPEIDTCDVCGGYRWHDNGGPPGDFIKQQWRRRFFEIR